MAWKGEGVKRFRALHIPVSGNEKIFSQEIYTVGIFGGRVRGVEHHRPAAKPRPPRPLAARPLGSRKAWQVGGRASWAR